MRAGGSLTGPKLGCSDALKSKHCKLCKLTPASRQTSRDGASMSTERRNECQIAKLAVLPIHLFLVPISFMSNTSVEKYFCVVAIKALAVVVDDTADS